MGIPFQDVTPLGGTPVPTHVPDSDDRAPAAAANQPHTKTTTAARTTPPATIRTYQGSGLDAARPGRLAGATYRRLAFCSSAQTSCAMSWNALAAGDR